MQTRKRSPLIFKTLPLILALLLAATMLGACGQTETEAEEEIETAPALSGTLQVFHAGSLTVPLAEVNEKFTELYPDVEVLAEGAGSATTIRKVTELGKECGIIASADYTLIPELMYPDYADWYIIFATNQMCLCYTDQSAYADEINSDNWYEILQREDVSYGRSDPDQDPCGYRTLMVWQLADKHYGGEASGLHDKLLDAEGDLMRPKSVELIALLESGDLDYAFEYTSVAAQHNLNYVELPPEINLADATLKDFYAEVEVEIAGSEPGTTITMVGKPIVYGITIPSNYPHKELAIAWMEIMLGSTGTGIMKANGQPPVTPAPSDNNAAVPEELQKYLQ